MFLFLYSVFFTFFILSTTAGFVAGVLDEGFSNNRFLKYNIFFRLPYRFSVWKSEDLNKTTNKGKN